MFFVKGYVILLELKKETIRRTYGRNFTFLEGTRHDQS